MQTTTHLEPEAQFPWDLRQQQLFLAALEHAEPHERAAFLDHACNGDAQLREAVENLLKEAEGLGDFLERPALTAAKQITPGNSAETAVPNEGPGTRIGNYILLEKLGEGGYGAVYSARQEGALQREVALKVVKLGMDTRQVIARFEAERQALARMDHPNIARVFDAGCTETGRPFFVMELVRGVRLTDYCDQERLSTEARLRLFVQVCDAIQHAHQKGVIHRDIKPSNILVALHNGRATPKVIDFGIAKATDQQRTAGGTVYTGLHQLVGTPAYMSPEQAGGSTLDVDTRSDIFSLGIVLYELLTGGTPFDGNALLESGIAECRRRIREEEPPSPSARLTSLGKRDLQNAARNRRCAPRQLIEQIRGDLDWIVGKAIEKDKARRYVTAAALAQDVEYYLAQEPVLARPPSNLYLAGKLVRRHRGAFAATLATALAILLGTGVSVRQAIRATRAEQKEAQLRRQAEHQREKARAQTAAARLNEYTADINLAHQCLLRGNYGRAVRLLDKHIPRPAERDLRGFEWHYLRELSRGDEHAVLPGQESPVRWLAFSPDGNLLAVGLFDKVNLWDMQTQTRLRTISQPVSSGVFCNGGQVLVLSAPGEVRLLDLATWAERKLPGLIGGQVAATRDGSVLAVPTGHGVSLWDTATWTEQTTLPGALPPLAFSSDRTLLATGVEGGLAVWSLNTRSAPMLMAGSADLFGFGWRNQAGGTLEFSADGTTLLAARPGFREQLRLNRWDAKSGEQLEPPAAGTDPSHTGMVTWLSCSPDGSTVASASMDHSIGLWDSQAAQVVSFLHGHFSEVWALAFSPDGRLLASGAKDGSVNLWTMPRPPKQDVWRGTDTPIAFSKDGRQLAVIDRRHGVLRILNAQTWMPEKQFDLEPLPFRRFAEVSLSGDFGLLAETVTHGQVRLRNTVTGETSTLRAGERMLQSIALSPDGRFLVTGGLGEPLRCWNLQTQTNVTLASENHRVLFSPRGDILAMFVGPKRIVLWDLANMTQRTALESDRSLGGSAAFSLNGRMLAVASGAFEAEQSVELWDLVTNTQVGRCVGHKQGISAVAFSADGKTLASASHDQTVKLWNTSTQQELLTFPQFGIGVDGLLFSPKGNVLAATQSGEESGIRFFRAPIRNRHAAIIPPQAID